MKIRRLQERVNNEVLEGSFSSHEEWATEFWGDHNLSMRRGMYSLAVKRLNRVMDCTTESKKDLLNRIHNIYDIPGRSYRKYESDDVLAFDAIASDLLLTHLVHPTGVPTNIARDFDWIVDPTNYVVSKQPWKFLDEWMLSELDNTFSRYNTRVVLEIDDDSTQSDYIDAVTGKYREVFGPDSFIAIPCTINFGTNFMTIPPLPKEIFPQDSYPIGLVFFPLDTVVKNTEIVGESLLVS